MIISGTHHVLYLLYNLITSESFLTYVTDHDHCVMIVCRISQCRNLPNRHTNIRCNNQLRLLYALEQSATVANAGHWYVRGNLSYKAFTDKKTFHDAQKMCAHEGQGGQLAILCSIEQQNSVQQGFVVSTV